jgi:hypothetical protein
VGATGTSEASECRASRDSQQDLDHHRYFAWPFLVRDDPALATGPSPFRRLSARQTFTHMLVMPVIYRDISGSRCGYLSTELEASRMSVSDPCLIR